MTGSAIRPVRAPQYCMNSTLRSECSISSSGVQPAHQRHRISSLDEVIW